MQAVRSAPRPGSIEGELAAYATALVDQSVRRPASWTIRFLAEVRLVRAHLAPIRTRAALASSFGRESFGQAEEVTWALASRRVRTSAVHVAYATRWLELAERETSPGG